MTHQFRQYYDSASTERRRDGTGFLNTQVQTSPASEYATAQGYASPQDPREFDSSGIYGLAPRFPIPTRGLGSNAPSRLSIFNLPPGKYYGFGPSAGGRIPISKPRIVRTNIIQGFKSNIRGPIYSSTSEMYYPLDADNGTSEQSSLSSYATASSLTWSATNRLESYLGK